MKPKFAVMSLLLVVLIGQLFAKGKATEYETTVHADKSGTVEQRQYFDKGTSHVYRLFTNYISYKFHGEGQTIYLTVTCEEKWDWNHCFALSEGQSYPAVFEFRSGHGNDSVQLTGQPGGNLTKPVTTKNTVVNFSTQ